MPSHKETCIDRHLQSCCSCPNLRLVSMWRHTHRRNAAFRRAMQAAGHVKTEPGKGRENDTSETTWMLLLTRVYGRAWARTTGSGQLDGPEEVGGLLEVRADGVDLGGRRLHADDAVFAQHLWRAGLGLE